MNSTKRLPLLTVAIVLANVPMARSQETPLPVIGNSAVDEELSVSPSATADQKSIQPAGRRRALILCGHPGDEDHRRKFSETIESLRKGLTEFHAFGPDDVWIQFGGRLNDEDDSVPRQVRGTCTGDELRKMVAELRTVLNEQDSLWVVVVGHSHFDGRKSWFNLPGPDIEQDEFARMFADVKCREQVFWMTIPASGFYVPPLSRKGRIVISATEADRNVNETLFPYVLAEELNGPFNPDEFDADNDKSISLFDLFVNVTRRVARNYADEKLLLTENALMDDNGDGRGTAVHLDYLSPELGGRKTESFSPRHLPNRDGTRAANSPLGVDQVRQGLPKKTAR